jgi:hypothetical protein
MEKQPRKSLYIETTIPSYATSRGSSDLLTATRQFVTKKFWEEERERFDLYTSQYVIDECSEGDKEAAKRRLDFLYDIPVFQKTDEIADLANTYFGILSIPKRAKADCFHLATCVVAKLNYLLSWNLTHFGPETSDNILSYNAKYGLWIPILIAPDYLLERIAEEEELL